MLFVPVLLQVLSSVERLNDLHSFFWTSRSALSMAVDPVLKACWLAKQRQSRAVHLAASLQGRVVLMSWFSCCKWVVCLPQRRHHTLSLLVSTLRLRLLSRGPPWSNGVALTQGRRGDVRADVAYNMSVLCRAAQFNRDECLQAFHAPDSPVNANSLNVFGQSPL